MRPRSLRGRLGHGLRPKSSPNPRLRWRQSPRRPLWWRIRRSGRSWAPVQPLWPPRVHAWLPPGPRRRQVPRRGPCPWRGKYLFKTFSFLFFSFFLFCVFYHQPEAKGQPAGLTPLKAIKRGMLSTPRLARPKSPPPLGYVEECRPQEEAEKGGQEKTLEPWAVRDDVPKA